MTAGRILSELQLALTMSPIFGGAGSAIIFTAFYSNHPRGDPDSVERLYFCYDAPTHASGSAGHAVGSLVSCK